MWVEAIGGGTAGDQTVHPRAAALVFARVPVGIEAAQKGSFLVADIVIVHIGVPGGDAGFLFHPDAVEALHQFEESAHHALHGEAVSYTHLRAHETDS